MDKLHMVPVSINQEYFDEEEFVSRINQGYQNSTNTKSTGLKPLYQEYCCRSIHPEWLKYPLRWLYDDKSPSRQNGLNQWEARFNEHAEALADEFGVEDYLRDVLVLNLNRFMAECSAGLTLSCETFKDYIYQCIFYDYAPDLDIRWHENRGWGVFAQRDLPPFTYVGLYAGNVLPTFYVSCIEFTRRFFNKYAWILSFNPRYCIDSEKRGNYTRFINHDEKDSKRLLTFSLQIANGDDPWPVPYRGFITNINSKGDASTPFFKDDEVLWNYYT